MSTITSLLTFILIAGVFVLFVVLLPVAIIYNVKAGLIYRERLAGKIEKLRLGKMLPALGIDIETYISSERGIDIHRHMNRCQECSSLEECDERMEQGGITADDIGFCSNEESLQTLTRTLK